MFNQKAESQATMSVMKITLLPLMGAFHLRYPHYNAVNVCELVADSEPETVFTTALEEAALERPEWQDTPELALPLTVAPWASRHRIPFHAVSVASPDPTAAQDFRKYIASFPNLNARLVEIDSILGPLTELLEAPLTLGRIHNEVLPLFAKHQHSLEKAFGDGPGTGWLIEKSEQAAERILALDAERVTVLSSAEQLPALETALGDRAEKLFPPSVDPSDEARERSFLDFAMQVNVPEPGNVLRKLRDLIVPEARYHEANILFANGHLIEALELLETVSHGDFSQPYFLPGYVLARLGQLRDLTGNRDGAKRAYRGVLALDFAPVEAREVARKGLSEAFALPEISS
jgi:hypothetical protein